MSPCCYLWLAVEVCFVRLLSAVLCSSFHFQANTVLDLADEELEEGFRFEANLNYHTACVFYRVMETMIPSKASSQQHSRLMYAAQKTRLTSTVYQNFVRENFTGGSCSDMYEVHGTSKLGEFVCCVCVLCACVLCFSL